MPRQAHTERLAFDIFECLDTGDLPKLLQILEHPTGIAAMQWNELACLRKACDNNQVEFVHALLPYCSGKDVGAALTRCLTHGNFDMFDLIVQHQPLFADWMEVDTLKMLVIEYHRACEVSQMVDQHPACVALHRFLNWTSPQMVEAHLYPLENDLVDNPIIFERFQNVLAQRQKDLLERNIEARVEKIEKPRKI